MNLLNKGVAEGNFDLLEKKDRVVYEKSTKIPNFACVTVTEEDHTLGNLIRQELLTDRRVRFAGYRKPHPLFDLVEIKIQSNGEDEPCTLVNQACHNLIHHIDAIETSFDKALENYKNNNNLQFDQMNLGKPPMADWR